MENALTYIKNGVINTYNTLVNLSISLATWFTTLSSNIGTYFSDLWSNNLSPAFQNIGTWFTNLGTNIGNFFTSLWTNISDFFAGIPEFFANFWTTIREFFVNIFVPSEENITSLVEVVKNKFVFIDTIKTMVNSFKSSMNNLNSVDEYYIDVAATKYTSATRIKILDFSWYSPYKEYGDMVLTGFIYILFLWRLFVHLPNIINGTGGDIVSAEGAYNKNMRGGK